MLEWSKYSKGQANAAEPWDLGSVFIKFTVFCLKRVRQMQGKKDFAMWFIGKRLLDEADVRDIFKPIGRGINKFNEDRP